jgi:hypothetical protein
MDITPTPHDEDHALHPSRHQQSEAVRGAYDPGPWWVYLALTMFFVSYGLGRDLDSGWATVAQAASWVILAGTAVWRWRTTRRRKSVASRRRIDAATWIATLGFTAVLLAVLFGGPYVLAILGVPLPHAISGLATGLLQTAAIPLGRWSFRRRVARVEVGE